MKTGTVPSQRKRSQSVPYAENTLQTTEDARFLKQYERENSSRLIEKLILTQSSFHLLRKTKEARNSLVYNFEPNQRLTPILRNKRNNASSNTARHK